MTDLLLQPPTPPIAVSAHGGVRTFARSGPYLLAIGIACASGLMYWLVAAWLRPNAPFPVTILYRFGDTDYLGLFYALSRFQFHEFITHGIEAPRLIPFPTGLSFLYALPIAVFGDAGFPVAASCSMGSTSWRWTGSIAVAFAVRALRTSRKARRRHSIQR